MKVRLDKPVRGCTKIYELAIPKLVRGTFEEVTTTFKQKLENDGGLLGNQIYVEHKINRTVDGYLLCIECELEECTERHQLALCKGYWKYILPQKLEGICVPFKDINTYPVHVESSVIQVAIEDEDSNRLYHKGMRVGMWC